MKKGLTLLLSLVGLCTYGQKLHFEKVLIDSTYVSAGVTTADIDRDGLTDIIAGDVWYKASDWKRKEIRPLGAYYATLVEPAKPMGSGARYSSNSIGNYTMDIDKDGWLDVIIFNAQGAPCYWYRNPLGNSGKYWEEYKAIEEFHNESPLVVDLFGDGNPVVLSGNHIGENKWTLSWYSIPDDPKEPWKPHVIGHPDDFNFSTDPKNNTVQFYAPGAWGHGLGVGDVDKDGLVDVITSLGWYKAPKNAKTKEKWDFYPLVLTNKYSSQPEFRFARIFVDDFDRDGDNDLIAGSAHDYGLWWFEQHRSRRRGISFTQHVVRMDISQLHSMNAADLDGDNRKEYIAGKRYLACLGKAPGASDPAVLIYVEHKKSRRRQPVVNSVLIDDNSGAGTQIWISDMNQDKKPDIITSNKKGTFLFLQK